METPLSTTTRRITRSQSKAVLSTTSNISSRKNEESKKCNSTKKTKQRSSLIDITNGSPIVGLATSNLMNETPISSLTKHDKSSRCKKTPGSGEALLRGQVQNLLQMQVEQVNHISKFLSFETVSGRNQFDSLGSVLESPVEDKVVSGMTDGKQQPDSVLKCENDIISRSLFLDFSEKESDCTSEHPMEQGIQKKCSMKDDEDDDASIWSVQVNVSTRDEDEVEQVIQEDEYKGEVSQLDELCEGIKNISMKEETPFMGKHVRFVYDSDDELVEEEEVLHLKGLPTPKGKHRRFQDEVDE